MGWRTVFYVMFKGEIDFLSRRLEMDALTDWEETWKARNCLEMLELGEYYCWQLKRSNRRNWWIYKL